MASARKRCVASVRGRRPGENPCATRFPRPKNGSLPVRPGQGGNKTNDREVARARHEYLAGGFGHLRSQPPPSLPAWLAPPASGWRQVRSALGGASPHLLNRWHSKVPCPYVAIRACGAPTLGLDCPIVLQHASVWRCQRIPRRLEAKPC